MNNGENNNLNNNTNNGIPTVTSVATPVTSTPATPVTPVIISTTNVEENNTGSSLGANVKIAPPSSEPVNASNSATAASANVASSVLPASTATPTIVATSTEKTDAVTTDINSADANTTVTEGENKTEETTENVNNTKPKKKKSIVPLLIFIIIGLGFYTFYSSNLYKTTIANLRYSCTPVHSTKVDKQLALDSTLVLDLYNGVKTTIREDYAQPEFNDTMKLYLAFRQLNPSQFYDSNCNMFDTRRMEPYTCDPNKGFVPKAFKEEDLKVALKRMFGEETEIQLNSIKLQNSCVGGYEYIPERGEFVEGQCASQNAIQFKVEKKLVEATSNRNTVVLVEEVKYHMNEKHNLPEYLKSGRYIYTFRLDMNYNYVLVSKVLDDKY